MTFGNVIPIDADVARQLARRQVRFRWLVAGVTALWLAVLVPTLIFTPLPPLAPFLALAVLVVLAEHRFVLFGDETSMSASIIVVVASIFVFANTAPLAGPMIIASIAGLYLPHLRSGSVSLPLANVSIFGLSAVCAASLTSSITPIVDTSAVYAAIAATVLASATYWYVNSVLTGGVSAVRLETNALDSMRTQAVSEWPVLILTVGAGLLAIAMTPRIAEFVTGLTAILTVFEIYVRRIHRHVGFGTPTVAHVGAIMIGVCAATYHTGVLGAAVAAIGSFFCVAGLGPLPGSHRAMAGIVVGAFVTSSAMVHFDVPIPAQFAACTASSFVAIGTLEVLARAAQQRTRLPRSVALGYLIPGAGESSWVAAISVLLYLTSCMTDRATAPVVALLVVSVCSTRMVARHVWRTGGVPRPTVPRSSVSASR